MNKQQNSTINGNDSRFNFSNLLFLFQNQKIKLTIAEFCKNYQKINSKIILMEGIKKLEE